MTVEIVELGAWGAATLIAEYDPERDAIAVDARAVRHIRSLFGEAEARRFIACAVAHERFHREYPGAAESAAHAYARAATGTDPQRYETPLRALR